MADPNLSQPPEFFEVVDDPVFRAMSPEDRRATLRQTRQVWRAHLDRQGLLADHGGLVDEEAARAAREAGVELEPGLFTGIGQDAVKGVNSLRTAWNVSGTEDTDDLVAIREYDRTHPGSLAAEDLQRDRSDGTGLWAAIRKNPAGMGRATLSGAVNSLPGSLAIGGASIAAGAGATAATGNPAVGLGAAMGAAGGVSEWQESGNRYLQKLEEAGAPMHDPDLLRAWLRTNRAQADQLKLDAAIEALPTAALDAAAGGFPALGLGARAAEQVGARVTGRAGRLLGQATEYGVEQGAQAALGAGGSIGSNLVAGEEIDGMAALQEALGEFISPLELLGPVGKLGRRLRGVAEPTVPAVANRVPEVEPSAETRPSSPAAPETAPAPLPAQPTTEDDDDLLGEREMQARLDAAAASRVREQKLAHLRANRAEVWRGALDDRADTIRERGGEGDGYLSAVEQELDRLERAQEGDRRTSSLADLAAVVRRVLPEGADPDTVGVLATELYGADAAGSRANIAAARDAVRAARERARVADTPLREAREAREAAEAARQREIATRRAEAAAALDAEHRAELARLDAARVTVDGAPDFEKLSDDEVGALAYAEPGDEVPDTLAPLYAEARRLHERDPDHDGAPWTPAAPILRAWRAAAKTEFDRRQGGLDHLTGKTETLGSLLRRGTITLPNRSATYAGELQALLKQSGLKLRPGQLVAVATAEEGDRLLERMAERLTVDHGFSPLESSSAALLDALGDLARGNDLHADHADAEGVRFSKRKTVGYRLIVSPADFVRVGDFVPPSFSWKGDAPTKRVLRGTSTFSSLEQALEYAKYSDGQIVELTGTKASKGALSGELVIPNARVSRIVYQRGNLNEAWKPADIRYSAGAGGSSIDSESAGEFTVRQDEQARQDQARIERTLTAHARGKAVRVDIVGRAETGGEGLPTQAEVAERFAERHSRKIVWYRVNAGPDQTDGFYHPRTPGLLYINVDAGQPVLEVVGHEAWHALASEFPALAREAQDALRADATDPAGYTERARRRGYRTDEVAEEFGADNAGAALLRPAFLDRLAARAPAVFRKFVLIARELLEQLRALLGDNAPAPLVRDIDRADRILAKAFSQWATTTRLRSAHAEDAPGFAGAARLAPNGKPSNLDARQYAQVRTPEFKRWFGDWENDPANASQALDENGEPLVVWHETQAQFDTFKPSSGGGLGPGVYFTTSDQYLTDDATQRHMPGYRRVAAFVNLRNPLIVPDRRVAVDTIHARATAAGFAWDIYADPSRNVAAWLKRQGHDGVWAKNPWKSGTRTLMPELTVLDPANIKSATDNAGTFDPDNADIRFAKGKKRKGEENPPADLLGGAGAGRAPEKPQLYQPIPEVANLPHYAAPDKSAPGYLRATKPKWMQAMMPAFKGNKRDMSQFVGKMLDAEWTPAQRSGVTRVVDYFGGGGGWGMHLSLAHFPNARELIVRDFEAPRVQKIKTFHEIGNDLSAAFREADPIIEAAVDAAYAKGNVSPSGIRPFILKADWSGMSDHAKGVLQAYVDTTVAMLAGEETAYDADAKVRRRVISDAKAAYTAAEAFRARGGSIRYESGDSYTATIHPGRETLAVVDPPYYNTSGYQGEYIVPLDTYLRSTDFIRKLAAVDNGIIYTDEAYWRKEPELSPQVPEDGDGRTGEDATRQIIDSLKHAHTVPVGERHEIIVTHPPGESAAARASLLRSPARVDESAYSRGLSDKSGGNGLDSTADLFGMAEGTAGSPEEHHGRAGNRDPGDTHLPVDARAAGGTPGQVPGNRGGAVAAAEAELEAAKAERDAYPNDPDHLGRRRAIARVKTARTALTKAKSAAALPAPVAAEITTLEARYKTQLARSGGIYKALEKARRMVEEGQPTAEDHDRLARLHDEHKRAVAEQRATKAKLDGLAGLKPAANWAPEEFEPARWAEQIDAARTPAELPAGKFRQLTDAQRNDLMREVERIADTKATMPDRAGLDAVRSNLRAMNAPVVREPTPVTAAEKTAALDTAHAVADEAATDDAALKRRLDRLAALKGGGRGWEDVFGGGDDARAVNDAEAFVPTDGARHAGETDPHPDDLRVAEPTAEDAEALRALDAVTPEQATRTSARDAEAARETAAQEEREAERGAPPPPTAGTKPRDGTGEFPDRGASGPVGAVYGHGTASDNAATKLGRLALGLVGWFRQLGRVVPEIPREARHLRPIEDGYKALLRGQEVVVHDAARQVEHILAPIMALEHPADPADRRELLALRERQRAVEKRIADPATPAEQRVRAEAERARLQTEALALNTRMADQPLTVFENFILWRDLYHRASTLTTDSGEPIALPFGVNLREAKAQAQWWAERVKGHDARAAITESIRRHEGAVLATWADLKARLLVGNPALKTRVEHAEAALASAERNIARLTELAAKRDAREKWYAGQLREARRALPGKQAEAQAARQAVAEDNGGLWNGGRAYFPHILPDHHSGRPDRVARTAADTFRAYLTNPVGSPKAIETRYAEAMFLHLAAVNADNLHMDIVRRDFAPLDQTAELEADRASLREAGKDVPPLEALARSRGLVPYTPNDRLKLALVPTIDRAVLAKALGRVLEDGPLAPQLAELGRQGITLPAQAVRDVLATQGKETWWVAPEAAAAFEAIDRQETPEWNRPFAQAAEQVQRYWKKYVLFFPHNYIRYEFNNAVADTGKLVAVDPTAAKAALADFARGLTHRDTEVWKFMRGEEVSADTAAAFRLGVFDTATLKEIEDMRELPAFEGKLMTAGEIRWDKLKGYLGRDWHKFSQYREATFRLAKYHADLARIRRGERPVYAGAYWKDVEAIGDSEPGAGDRAQRRAAAISLATMNDFAAVSRSGAHLRRYLVPFWSFTENNFRYHVNLLRNLYDSVRAGETGAAQATGTALAAGAAFTTRAAVGIVLRAWLPLVLLALYNAQVGGEDELSDEDRRRLHLNLGRDAQGRVRVLYLENDLMAFLKWFGGGRALGNLAEVARGRTDLATAAKDFAKNALRDSLNTALSVGPIPRTVALVALDRDVGMDISEARTVIGRDKVWAVAKEALGMGPSDWLRSAIDRDYVSARGGLDWLNQLVFQVRLRDPESWAYYEVRDKAEAFLEERTGKTADRGARMSPETTALRSFRRAIFQGDIAGALAMQDRLLRYGYTADRLKTSLRSFDPLASLPKGDGTRRAFLDSLDATGRAELDRAYLYAERYRALENQAARLFPRAARTPEATRDRAETYRNDPQSALALRAVLEEQARQDEDRRKLDAAALQRKAQRGMR